MNNSSLATALLGRRARLHEPPNWARDPTGEIVLVYLDDRGMHYVLLVAGRLVQADSATQFTVLEEADW
jgi:hypothetical protein